MCHLGKNSRKIHQERDVMPTGIKIIKFFPNLLWYQQLFCTAIYNHINEHLRGAFNKFPDFLFIGILKSKTLENSVSYCYTSYEMTDQFLWLQLQMNSYSKNWNKPY